jgi:hypothetical protein
MGLPYASTCVSVWSRPKGFQTAKHARPTLLLPPPPCYTHCHPDPGFLCKLLLLPLLLPLLSAVTQPLPPPGHPTPMFQCSTDLCQCVV